MRLNCRSVFTLVDLLAVCGKGGKSREDVLSHKAFGDLHYPFVRAFITAAAYAEEIRKLHNPSHPHSMVEMP